MFRKARDPYQEFVDDAADAMDIRGMRKDTGTKALGDDWVWDANMFAYWSPSRRLYVEEKPNAG